MKKIGYLFLCVFLLSGCGKMLNTPTKRVEMFFEKYQTLHADVIRDLDHIIAEEELFNTENRDQYRDLMKKHYQDLTYVIKEEEINGDQATVTAEITVTDFSKAMSDAEKYLKDHPEEFLDEKGKYDDTLYMKYRLDQLKEAKDKVKYTLKLKLTKDGDEWKLEELSDSDYQKINGIYNY